MSPDIDAIADAFRRFADAVKRKFETLAAGQPEDQLRTPFDQLMTECGAAYGLDVVPKPESPIEDIGGRPDFAISVD